MILEYAKLMSTTHRVLDPPSDLHKPMYKITHENHPSTIWAGESEGNYKWMYDLWFWVCKEYWWRHDKIHKTWGRLYNKLSYVPENIPKGEFSPPPMVMPKKYIIENNPIESYRKYYIGHKIDMAEWGGTEGKMRQPPNWFLK